MIVFVLTYAVLVLLGLSLVGSVSPENPSAKRAGNPISICSLSIESSPPEPGLVQGGRQAKCLSHLHSDRFFRMR